MINNPSKRSTIWACRQKQIGRRLNGYVNSSASRRLKKLAEGWGLLFSRVVERLTREADERYAGVYIFGSGMKKATESL